MAGSTRRSQNAVSKRLRWSFRECRYGLEKVRRDRPALLPPHGSGFLVGRLRKRHKTIGLGAKSEDNELVRIMLDADLELMGEKGPSEGKKILEDRFNGWHKWEHQVVSMEK